MIAAADVHAAFMDAHGRSRVCICKKADPDWLAEDERLLQELTRLKAEYRAIWDRYAAAGWSRESEPWPADLGEASNALYGPMGVCEQIERHRYGVPPGGAKRFQEGA